MIRQLTPSEETDEGLTNVRKEKLVNQKYVLYREGALSLLE